MRPRKGSFYVAEPFSLLKMASEKAISCTISNYRY
jgi:hypothetical protein